jgi:hypothetical protein
MIDDRIVKGMIAGITAALVQNIYAYLCRLVGVTNVIYLDVAEAVLLNKNLNSLSALLVGFLGQLVIDGFWGCIYSYLIYRTSSQYYLIKGVFTGCSIWFLVRVIFTKIIPLPVLSENTPAIALFFFIGAALFGLTMAVTLKLLNTEKIPE